MQTLDVPNMAVVSSNVTASAVHSSNLNSTFDYGEVGLTESPEGARSKYSELLNRKNMRNQSLVLNQQRII